ncbi:hypothetical protein BK703_16525 [Bacillus thuringiensis serovar silo]|nr:hypothetical protein BK703_16525 [Bacillus thuringiensis serovar silo]OTW74323.1 hypothetical protein BK700_01520 [Bacillus thuringiensis serovar toguchini]
MGNLGEVIERLYIGDTIDITWYTFETRSYTVVMEDGRVFLRRKGSDERVAYRRYRCKNTIDLLDRIKEDMKPSQLYIVESYVIYPKGHE